jgi:hypothetical protein
MRAYVALTVLFGVIVVSDITPVSVTAHAREIQSQAASSAPAMPQSVREFWNSTKAHPRPLEAGLVITVLTVIGGAVLLYRTTLAGPDPLILRLVPSFFFWLGMIYIGLLLLMAVVYNLTKEPNAGTTVVGGVLPLAVPWFGALGAVTISLEGVFLWNSQWDRTYNYWHIGRPLFGAVLGIVAFFLFVVIVSASGSSPKFLEGQPGAAKDYIIFYVVAFLVGYREETFRELIKRATDLILKAGPLPPPAPTITFKVGTASPLEIICPDTAANANAKVTVDVQNSSPVALTGPAAALTLAANTPPGTFAVTTDNVSRKGDLAAGQGRSVDITFAPKADGEFTATLTVTGTNLSTPKTIRVTGKTPKARP